LGVQPPRGSLKSTQRDHADASDSRRADQHRRTGRTGSNSPAGGQRRCGVSVDGAAKMCAAENAPASGGPSLQTGTAAVPAAAATALAVHSATATHASPGMHVDPALDTARSWPSLPPKTKPVWSPAGTCGWSTAPVQAGVKAAKAAAAAACRSLMVNRSGGAPPGRCIPGPCRAL